MFHPKGPTFVELARQALSSTERGYDLLAPKFDYTPFRTPDWLLDAVMPHLGEPGSIARGLDVCCGTGAALRRLRPLCREAVAGVDVSAGMLEEAERRLVDAPGTAPIRLIRADALAMPFAGEFDLAVTFGALGHIVPKDEAQFVDSIRLALRVGGRLAFVTSGMPPILSARWVLSRAFNAAMHVRNAIWRPPFIMYYLTFLLPRIRTVLEETGYEVEERRGVFPRPFDDFVLVIATRRR